MNNHLLILGSGKFQAPFIFKALEKKYPAPIEDANLKQIAYLKDRFKVIVGFSDHTTSLIAGSYAVIAGSKIIEKHIKNINSEDSVDGFFLYQVKVLKNT